MGTALVTGASSGLGEQFAYGLARRGYALVLVARRENRLKSVALKARSLGAPAARIIVCDLSGPDGPGQVRNQLEADSVAVDFLVNNAGFGTRGRFYELPLAREIEEVDLNVRALVAMTGLFLPAMVARRSGTIINVASTSAFQPIPYMAIYAATKAFVLSFSQAVADELKGTGVKVMALCPGPVRTEFQEVAGTTRVRIPQFIYIDAETVVAQALAAAERGKRVLISGALNLIAAGLSRLAPRALAGRVAGRLFRPDDGDRTG
jgi:short-subunit dehydrogenase